MKSVKLFIVESFLSAAGTYVYILLVAGLMYFDEQLFGEMDKFWGPVAFLLLFVLSLTITGALILGKPLVLYLNDFKKNAIQLFFCNIVWLFVFVVLTFAVLSLTK